MGTFAKQVIRTMSPFPQPRDTLRRYMGQWIKSKGGDLEGRISPCDAKLGQRALCQMGPWGFDQKRGPQRWCGWRDMDHPLVMSTPRVRFPEPHRTTYTTGFIQRLSLGRAHPRVIPVCSGVVRASLPRKNLDGQRPWSPTNDTRTAKPFQVQWELNRST